MIRILASLETVYAWADQWLSIDYMYSRYVMGSRYASEYQYRHLYDQDFEVLMFQWNLYLVRVELNI